MYGQMDFESDDPIQLEFDKKNDHLNLEKDPQIKEIISNEKFLFSDLIYKKNKFGFNQSRNFVLTDNALYNLKGKKLQRRFDISKLKGITTSVAKGCQEFVIHGNEEEHDYLYSSKHKYTIIYLLEGAYEKLRGKELDFIYTESASLKNRMTTKNEKKSDPKFSRMDDSELYDIKDFFKHLFYEDNNDELIYVDKIEDEEGNPIPMKNMTPLIQTENTNKANFQSQNSLKMSEKNNKRIRATLSSFRDNNFGNSGNNDDDLKGNIWNTNEEIGEYDDEFYEEEGDEAVALKPAKYEDFQFVCCIGKGKNSSTYIAKNEKYGVYYAVKAIDKEKILLNKSVDSLKVEKKILTSLVSLNKCVVVMVNCFQTFDKIFFTYPFYRGGDLLSFMEKNGGNFRKRQDLIFFYVCQLVMFLIRMHENKIIYRNLKPENIIIENKGNLKMTDFSKSKIITFDGDKGLSLVGAPEYMAPEVILGTGQKYEVDWWSLGILIYQMYYGFTPFDDDYIDKIYQKILYTNVIFDSNYKIDKNLKSLISGLLEKDVTKRIKDSNIKNHPYFTEGHNVDWNKVANFEIECPAKPNINEEKEDDIQNFDSEFTEENFNNEEIKSGEVLEYIKSADSCGAFDYFH
jgi:serine/threonine protein kinase